MVDFNVSLFSKSIQRNSASCSVQRTIHSYIAFSENKKKRPSLQSIVRIVISKKTADFKFLISDGNIKKILQIRYTVFEPSYQITTSLILIYLFFLETPSWY